MPEVAMADTVEHQSNSWSDLANEKSEVTWLPAHQQITLTVMALTNQQQTV